MPVASSSVQIIEITANQQGQRLDNYLLGRLKGVPKSRIYKLLRSGQVRVNKGRKKPDYRLQNGDLVRIPPVTFQQTPSHTVPDSVIDEVRQTIIYQDDDLLALNKPAGMAVHGGSGIAWGVIEVLKQMPDLGENLELVHRLDRETSGCLLIARNRVALMQLHDQFRDDNAMQKTYRALLAGRWQGGDQLVDAPLKKNELRGGERMVQVDPEGKQARTLFSPLEYGETVSLMDITLYTGRTHQIRVHAAYCGHPVAGDSKYGDPDLNKHLKQAGFRRMYLHAHEIQFTMNDRKLSIQAPLDDEWTRLLQELNE